jgi:anti-sigma factor RsiW
MNTARLRRPLHRQLKLLPWYVNCTLEPKEARKMAAHVTACEICQQEVGELVRLFSARARTVPKRPVDEARLDDLFSRIDRYEAERRRPARTERSSLRELLTTGIMGWLGARPALVAGALAIALLAVIGIPRLYSPTAESPYQVLTDENAPAEELRIKLRFQSATSADAVERLVRSGLTQQKLSNPYRIEQRATGEYVVIFEKKPSVAALSHLIDAWQNAPGVAEVTIDGA